MTNSMHLAFLIGTQDRFYRTDPICGSRSQFTTLTISPRVVIPYCPVCLAIWQNEAACEKLRKGLSDAFQTRLSESRERAFGRKDGINAN